MENKIIRQCINKSILILSLVFLGGMIFGIVFEKVAPSDYNFVMLSEQDIYINNINALKRTIGYGFLSFGLYCYYFFFIFGNLIGQGGEILYGGYGTEGVIYGFLPHAVIETISCLLAALIPVFFWIVILNAFLKKNDMDISKKKVAFRSIFLIILTACAVFFTCRAAAYIEYNVTEMFWQNQ